MKNIKLSVDDGCSSDVRVAVLCKKYGVDAIFYWPCEWHSLAHDNGYTPLTLSDALNISKEFSVGSHTITHRHLTKLPQEEAEYEISESQLLLQNIFGVPILNFAPPRVYTNDLLTEFTMKFYQKQRLTKEPGLVHVHPNSGANNNKPWRDCITVDTKELFMHSWELDKYDVWDELEGYLSES